MNESKTKIAAIVILYNPNKDDAESNILRYLDDIDKLIVWKNSSVMISLPEDYSDKIVYMGDETNQYIAKPLNDALDWCVRNHFDFLLTMDQDSTWIDFTAFKQSAEQIDLQQVAIIAPNINACDYDNNKPLEIASTITSGSLTNVDIAKKLGGFREDYEIYWVDGEFCYWARSNGYKILQLSNHQLQQKFGSAKRIYKNIHAANYSSKSYYFLYRNMIWMHREFPKGANWKTILYTCKLYIPGILLGEAKKWEKLKAICKAFSQGFFSKIKAKRKVIT